MSITGFDSDFTLTLLMRCTSIHFAFLSLYTVIEPSQLTELSKRHSTGESEMHCNLSVLPASTVMLGPGGIPPGSWAILGGAVEPKTEGGMKGCIPQCTCQVRRSNFPGRISVDHCRVSRFCSQAGHAPSYYRSFGPTPS